MLYTDRLRLGRILVDIALSKRSRSSNAVYHAMLALASYYRGDDIMEVDQYKRKALRDLYTYVDFSMCQATDHIAANLVLCVLEVKESASREVLNMLTPCRCSKPPVRTPLGLDTSVV
jgi:hypothetical protein